MAVTLQGSTLNNIHIGNSGAGGGGGAISAVNGAENATSISVTSSTYAASSTVVSVTATTGTKALITIGAQVYKPDNLGGFGIMSIAVSGATTIAATDDRALNFSGPAAFQNAGMSASRQFLITGLTAGSNTFTLQQRSTAGTWQFSRRDLIVQTLSDV